VLYHHVIRRRVEVELDAEFDDPLSRHIDARWREKLAGGSLFVNDQFVTLVRRPARGKAGCRKAPASCSGARRADELEADPATAQPARRDAGAGRLARRLRRAVLGDYRPQRPWHQQRAAGAALRALQRRDAPGAPPFDETDIGRMLPYRRASFGLDAMELRGSAGADFAAILSLKDYPDATSPGLLDALLRLPFEMVVTESFAPHERTTARERIDLALRRRARPTRKRRPNAPTCSPRATRWARGGGLWRPSPDRAGARATLARLDDATACAAALADTGAIAVREDTNLEPAFWGQFPGNEAYLVRRALISTANMASFGSLPRLRAGAGERQPLGRCGDAAGDHQRHAVLLQLPPRRSRQLLRHRPVADRARPW
jgi:type IV secretion system protein VirB4